MIPLFIIIFLLALLPDLYIWHSFIRCRHWLWGIAYWLPTAALVALPLVAGAGKWQHEIFQLFTFLFLLLVIPKFLFTLCSLAGRGMAVVLPASAAIGHIVGLAIGIMMMLAVAYGMTQGWKRVVVKYTDVSSEGIPPSFDGYAIVQLSDFHIGTYRHSPGTVAEIVDKVNEIHPDAIFFTGDLVNIAPDEISMFIPTLARMKAKDGVFSILGNHDYCEYRRYTVPDSPAKRLAELVQAEQGLGWTVLRNEHCLLRQGNGSIALIGVENDDGSSSPSRADLKRALRELDGTLYKILLSHDPSYWRRAVLPDTDIHLTLSGHTHAFQLKIGGFSPAQWMYPEWGGLYREGARLLHVSTGVGSNIAFRLGTWPEINVIRLHSR